MGHLRSGALNEQLVVAGEEKYLNGDGIDMIGGMSWESSAIYHTMLNEVVKERLGGHHLAETVMYSIDFAEIKLFHLMHTEQGE